MKYDFQASLLAHTFTNPCLGRKPKARVVTDNVSGATPNFFNCQLFHFSSMHAQKMCVKVKQQMENTKTKQNLKCVCERKTIIIIKNM
jgi:hypothetical protein